MDLRAVSRVLGFLLCVTAVFLLLPLLLALAYGESDWLAFLIAAGGGLVCGGTALWAGRGAGELRVREGFAVVTFGWLAVGLLGAVPFVLSGQIPCFSAAAFESISGFTTTGASILADIESCSRAVLFWRSLTQWLGGMGIVLLALAVLPLLGVGGMQLYRAEVPGPVPDRLTPRIRQTAKLLWGVYVAFTTAEILLLMLAGLGWFDAVCHAFATMATGGFSTRNASVGAFAAPLVEWIVILFMFLAGTNFGLHYLALRGNLKIHWRDEEFRFYLRILVGAVLLIILALRLTGPGAGWEETIRQSLFQVISISTTTGFATTDYLFWPPVTHVVLLLLMAVGGCAGSTGGGIKVMRVLILLRQAKSEMLKLLHPRAVLNLWFNERSVSPTLATNVLGFFLLFMLVYIGGILSLTLAGRDLVTAVGATAATLGNIGPGLQQAGPAGNYAFFTDFEKWLLVVLMLMGRLEIYTVLVLFMSSAWRRS